MLEINPIIGEMDQLLASEIVMEAWENLIMAIIIQDYLMVINIGEIIS
jgi:hypothetical protein